jgi:hypothetical protein
LQTYAEEVWIHDESIKDLVNYFDFSEAGLKCSKKSSPIVMASVATKPMLMPQI